MKSSLPFDSILKYSNKIDILYKTWTRLLRDHPPITRGGELTISSISFNTVTIILLESTIRGEIKNPPKCSSSFEIVHLCSKYRDCKIKLINWEGNYRLKLAVLGSLAKGEILTFEDFIKRFTPIERKKGEKRENGNGRYR